MLPQKLRGQFLGDLLAPAEFLGDEIDSGQHCVEFRPVGKDHVVDGDAVVKAALDVEVEHFVHGDRRVFLLDVGERSAVAHRLQGPAVQAEEVRTPTRSRRWRWARV